MGTHAFSQDNELSLSSLEWPPYTSDSLAEKGAASAVVTAAFKAMGYTLKIKFFPWERAVLMAKTDKQIAGYFPEYYSVDNENNFVYSDPIGIGPLGFAQRKDSPVKWSSLKDLKGISIGTVDGYINTAEFDDMAAAKTLKIEPVTDDATNLVKLGNKRIKLAVVDKNVLTYLLNNERNAQTYKDAIEFNSSILENKKLFVCFRKDAEGVRMAGILNQGLKKINPEKIMADYYSKFNH